MFAVVLALAAGLAAIAPTSAHASSAGATGNSGGFWVTMTPGETFTQAVTQASQESPGQVTAALNRMLQHQQAGQGVYIPESKNGALVQVKASRSDLTGALAAAESTAAVAGSAATAIVPYSAPQASWPVRGNACGSNRAWCNLVYVIDAEFCSQTCTLEDELYARLTVNPSVYGSNLVSWTVLYSPNHGDFDGYHFQWFVLKFAAENQCGTGNTSSFSTSTSNKFTTNCDTVLWNSRNTTAVEYWAHLKPNGSWYSDKAKDGTAVCQPESTENTYCLY